MTTSELIAELQRLDPSDKGRVEVPVGCYTRGRKMKTYQVTFNTNADVDDCMDGEAAIQTVAEFKAKTAESAANKARRQMDAAFIVKVEELRQFQIFDHAFTGLEVVEAFNKKGALKKSISSDKMYASPLGQIPSEISHA